MASVFRKTVTKPIPANAEVSNRKGERFARWKDAKGQTRKAPGRPAVTARIASS